MFRKTTKTFSTIYIISKDILQHYCIIMRNMVKITKNNSYSYRNICNKIAKLSIFAEEK